MSILYRRGVWNWRHALGQIHSTFSHERENRKVTGNTEMMIERLPQDFTLRHPTLEDIEAVTKLLNACEIAEDGQAETTIADMRTYWQRPGFNLATDAWVVLSPQGQIVASAGVGHREHVRIFTGADVHPEYRGRGI